MNSQLTLDRYNFYMAMAKQNYLHVLFLTEDKKIIIYTN
jgi:hypothetical protein